MIVSPRVPVLLTLLVAFFTVPAAHAARYKIIAKTGYGSFNYTAPFSSGSSTAPGIGVAGDVSFGQASSLGFDLLIGLGLADRLVSYSQVHFLYKYYPMSYNSFVVSGDADNNIAVRSTFYPYVTAGLGYSTLVVKAKASSSSTLVITTNSQYFDAVVGGGTDFSIGERWGLNFQALASYGQGGTATGTLSALAITASLGAFWTF
jgi:hypothetical protein